MPAASAATHAIQITKNGFSPSSTTVQVGDAVKWTNTDKAPHKVVSDTGKFQSTGLTSGQSFTYTFNVPGTYGYHDGLHPSLKGSVVVSPAPSVSVRAARKAVTFGGKVALSGNISSGKSGQAVEIRQRGCGIDTFSSIMTVYTNSFGRWTANVTPAEETDFEANWNGATSATSVSVRPRLVLQRLAGRYYRLSATAFATKFVGKYALIQRFTRAHGWRSFKRVTYKTFRALSGQVRVSQVRFRAKIRRGLRIRAFMPSSQTGECYIAGSSRAIRS